MSARQKIWRRGLILAILALSLLFPALSAGAGFQIKQLTNNNAFDRDPQINANGWVVWQGFDGNDYEIFLWKGGGSPINISNH